MHRIKKIFTHREEKKNSPLLLWAGGTKTSVWNLAFGPETTRKVYNSFEFFK